MAKYSYEFKLKVVLEYLKGDIGYNSLAVKYGVPNKYSIRMWVKAYEANGEKSLRRSRQRDEYPLDFKLHAVELYLSTEQSYSDVALSLGMKEPSVLANWGSRYRAVGIDGLRPQRKGRRPAMQKNTNDVSIPADAARLAELERENLELRIKVAYLKELRRLQLETLGKKKKPESLTASAKNLS